MKHPFSEVKRSRLAKAKTLWVLLGYVGLALAAGCALNPNRPADPGFQERYQAYQDELQAATVAINQDEKDYAAAIGHYTSAIGMSPFEPNHYYYRAVALYKRGQWGQAIEDFDKVLILDSRWSSAYVFRGLCREQIKEYGKALFDYQRALGLNPDDPGIHNNLAWLYATAEDRAFRDPVLALEHAGKAAELSKEGNAQILDTLARAFFMNGKVKEAIETQQKALKLEPENQGFIKNLKTYEVEK